MFLLLCSVINLYNMINKKYIDAKQASELLQISRSHLYLLTRKGKVPSNRPFGGRIYYNEDELLNLLKR